MAIIYCKEGTLWPIAIFAMWRTHEIEYYGDSVLIVLANKSLISVCSVGYDDSDILGRGFGSIYVR